MRFEVVEEIEGVAAVVSRTVNCCAEVGREEGEVLCDAMAGIEIREAGGCSRKCEW
jgi:hypothetical protein